MNDGFATVGVPLLRVIFDHVVADADDHVGLLEAEGDPVLGFEAYGAQRQFVGKGNCALGHEGGGNRNMQYLGESDQRLRQLRRGSRRCRPG